MGPRNFIESLFTYCEIHTHGSLYQEVTLYVTIYKEAQIMKYNVSGKCKYKS